MEKLNKILFIAFFASVLVFLSYTNPTLVNALPKEKWPKDVLAVTPNPGATIHKILLGIGPVVEKYTPIEHWIVEPTGGPAVWGPMMKKGECHFSMESFPGGHAMFRGEEWFGFKEPMPVRTMFGAQDYFNGIWTTPKTGIRKVSDLKGKSILAGLPGNTLFTRLALTMIASAGLSRKDLKSLKTLPSIKEATTDLIEGRIDAFYFPAVPTAIMEINETKGECVFVELSKEQAEYVIKEIPGYAIDTIPSNDPRFSNKREIKNAIVHQTGMYAAESLHPDIVYEIVKAILEHTDEFSGSHPSAKYLSINPPGHPVSPAAPAYHDGAIKYFKEKKLWSVEMQQHQDEMMKQLREILKK